MPASISRSWWTSSAGSDPDPDPAKPDSSESTSQDGGSTQPAQSDPSKAASSWPFSVSLVSNVGRGATENPLMSEVEENIEEQKTWLTSLAGSQIDSTLRSLTFSTVSNPIRAILGTSPQRYENIHAESAPAETETRNPQTSWFAWPFSSSSVPADSESDLGDKREIEAFREAKSAIESSKESCHYAVYKHHHTDCLYLAVSNTSTESAPVQFKETKRPIMPHQILENAIPETKPTKTQEPPSGSLSNGLCLSSPPSGRLSKFSSPQPSKSTSQKLSTKDVETSLREDHSDEVQKVDSSVNGTPTIIEAFDAAVSDLRPCHRRLQPVLPNLDTNFRVITLSTKLRLWSEAIIHKEPHSERHIYKSTRPSVNKKRRKVIKKALVITVHSFLPIKFVRSVISQDTGSAASITDFAVDAVHRWVQSSDDHDLDVQSISLEGIGTVDARVKESLRLIDNWSDAVKGSDFILLVSNSVASPAAIQILQQMARVPELALETKKVGFLSMSGALHGPVVGLDARIIRRAYSYSEFEIIKELFELQKGSSELSKRLIASMNDLCRANVKSTFIGSVDDQFIPISSSVCYQTSHPNIFKGIYIDEDVDVPAFIIRLIFIILTMENVGFANHYHLLRDLSELTQGPTAFCCTHGEIFKCSEVYDNGIKFALETTSLKMPKCAALNQHTTHVGESERNLYNLPWNVRGLLHDMLMTKHIKSSKILRELVADYRAWHPTTRHWREIKQCFAALDDIAPDDLIL